MFFSHCIHTYRLVACIHIRQCAHIAGALNIILAALWANPGSRASQVSGEHGQVSATHNIASSTDMLGNAKGIEYHGLIGSSIKTGYGVQVLYRHPG